jgi:hypothetical protein
MVCYTGREFFPATLQIAEADRTPTSPAERSAVLSAAVHLSPAPAAKVPDATSDEAKADLSSRLTSLTNVGENY